jgi:hypothetical protein
MRPQASWFGRRSKGGPRRARTAGLLRATQALSQLSYGPVETFQCSSELEISGPIDPLLLVVSRGGETQLDEGSPHRHLQRQQVALNEIGAIRGDRIDLPDLVPAMNKAGAAAPAPSRSDLDDVAVSRRPFALNPKKSRPEIEDQVVPLVTEGLEDAGTELQRLQRDRLLRQHAFLIWRQHGQHFSRATGRTVARPGDMSA